MKWIVTEYPTMREINMVAAGYPAPGSKLDKWARVENSGVGWTLEKNQVSISGSNLCYQVEDSQVPDGVTGYETKPSGYPTIRTPNVPHWVHPASSVTVEMAEFIASGENINLHIFGDSRWYQIASTYLLTEPHDLPIRGLHTISNVTTVNTSFAHSSVGTWQSGANDAVLLSPYMQTDVTSAAQNVAVIMGTGTASGDTALWSSDVSPSNANYSGFFTKTAGETGTCIFVFAFVPLSGSQSGVICKVNDTTSGTVTVSTAGGVTVVTVEVPISDAGYQASVCIADGTVASSGAAFGSPNIIFRSGTGICELNWAVGGRSTADFLSYDLVNADHFATHAALDLALGATPVYILDLTNSADTQANQEQAIRDAVAKIRLHRGEGVRIFFGTSYGVWSEEVGGGVDRSTQRAAKLGVSAEMGIPIFDTLGYMPTWFEMEDLGYADYTVDPSHYAIEGRKHFAREFCGYVLSLT